MKKLIITAFIFVSTFTTNTFAEVKMGIILGFKIGRASCRERV